MKATTHLWLIYWKNLTNTAVEIPTNVLSLTNVCDIFKNYSGYGGSFYQEIEFVKCLRMKGIQRKREKSPQIPAASAAITNQCWLTSTSIRRSK